MEKINNSYLFMLPKRHGVESVNDYRPISLSNSIYLIMAKVLADRLREVIGVLIELFQYAFISGRQLPDSVAMAGEILAAWKVQGTKGFMWKVDFAKAYDSLDWRFLWAVLQNRGFPKEWIKWMKRCVTSQSFSALINGRPTGGWIRPQRGIGQGCPLAPMLFILAADVLYSSAAQACASGSLKGFQTHSQPLGIPLLQYADDTLFFMEGSMEEAKNLSTLLDIFAYCSGFRLNREKSEFTGFGLSQDEESQCSRALGTPMGTLPIQYLGLPLSTGQLRSAYWESVVGKVEQRLEGWKAKVLLKGGRLVLLKSVLSVIPTFYLFVFKIPASIEQRLSGLMRRFFWTGSKEGRGLALVAWDDICKPTCQGGLGVPHLNTMNVALLTKWVKRIIGSEEDVIRAVMRDRYEAGVAWDKMTTRVRGASAFWRGLGKVVPIIQKIFSARLGDSALFRFYLDEWSDKGCLREKFPRLFVLTRHPQGTVKECWDGGWNPSLAAHLSK